MELSDRLAAARLSHPAARVLRPLLFLLAGERSQADALVLELMAVDDPWLSAVGRLMRIAYAENDGDVASMREDAALGVDQP